MKKIAMFAAAAAMGLGLAACDSAAENNMEDQADAVEDQADATADAMTEGDVSEATEEKADAIEDAGEAKADAMEDAADDMDADPQ
ncbi:hypothetical protein D6851_04790 [Altericroceibacterium spongiae]|uniref:Uncharacterized protein n=1 Tax=Altericroceibacterium spongiae TaxID=2320269 RepID=A0A420EPC9_9SPHN|nr:hypothetical protein [Altericroceibacterium spongiae]RKF22538.1 hypothetical protein D6851_04790 [Altericroceibacterium spongiae]